MRGVTGVTPEEVKGAVYLGGGATTPVFSRAVDKALIQGFHRLNGDFSEKSFPDRHYLSFDPKSSFSNKLSDKEKQKFQEWTGLSWDWFLKMYRPELEEGKVRLYFINDEEQTGDGQARIYYEDETGISLLACPKTRNRPEILANIHPALKELVGDHPENHHVALSGLPSKDYPILFEEKMRLIYQALGVTAHQIKILTDKSEERRLEMIEEATIIDVSGGNQRVYESEMGKKPAVVQAVINKEQEGTVAVLTTSASCAAIGPYMIAGAGGQESNPLSVSRYNVRKCGTWVVTGLGVLEGIFTDTHLLGPKKSCNGNGECEIVETGRDRVSRFLAALLSLHKLYGVPEEDLPLGIASTEGTFGEIQQGKLRVISDHAFGGCYVIDPRKIDSFEFDLPEGTKEDVVTLISAKAYRQGATEPTELIWDKKTQKKKGSSGCYLTTSLGREEDPNAFDGVGMVWNGEELDLNSMTLTVARVDRGHSFPLAEGCRLIDENGNDMGVYYTETAMALPKLMAAGR